MKNKKIVFLIILIFTIFLLTVFCNVSYVNATEVIGEMSTANQPGGISNSGRNC